MNPTENSPGDYGKESSAAPGDYLTSSVGPDNLKKPKKIEEGFWSSMGKKIKYIVPSNPGKIIYPILIGVGLLGMAAVNPIVYMLPDQLVPIISWMSKEIIILAQSSILIAVSSITLLGGSKEKAD